MADSDLEEVILSQERGSRRGLPADNYPQIRRARMQQLRQQQGEQGGGDEQQGQQR